MMTTKPVGLNGLNLQSLLTCIPPAYTRGLEPHPHGWRRFGTLRRCGEMTPTAGGRLPPTAFHPCPTDACYDSTLLALGALDLHLLRVPRVRLLRRHGRVDNDDDRFVRTPQEWLVPHLPSRAGDGGLKWRPKIERDAGCCTKRRGLAGVHNPACMLLQSLAEKCRELIYGCGLLQDGHFSHADVAVAWWASADGPACILSWSGT
jgi:hypothetical protein